MSSKSESILLEIDQDIRRSIILFLENLSSVESVYEIGSSEIRGQKQNYLSDCDLLITIKHLDKKELGTLKIVLKFLLDKYPQLFKHRFLVLPSKISKEFLEISSYSHFWKTDFLGVKRKDAKSNEIKNLIILTRFEWLLNDFFILRRILREVNSREDFSKLRSRSLRYVLFLNQNYLNKRLSSIGNPKLLSDTDFLLFLTPLP